MHENQAAMDESKPIEEVAVSIVIPLFNEQEIIQENLEILAAFFNRMVGAGKWTREHVEHLECRTLARLVGR